MRKEEVEIVFLEKILDLKKLLNQYVDDNTSEIHPDSIALTCDVLFNVSEKLNLIESSSYSSNLYNEAVKISEQEIINLEEYNKTQIEQFEKNHM